MFTQLASSNLYTLTLHPDSSDYTPLGDPIINSLLRVYRCEAGFLIETPPKVYCGGYYLRASRITTLPRSVDVAFRSQELIIFDIPGRVTIALSPIVNELIERIVEKQ